MLLEFIKKIPFARKCYRSVRQFSPNRILFRYNLKKVEEFDKEHGTSFGGRMYWAETGTLKERANDYSPSPEKYLIKALKKLSVTGQDAAADMGCGKGYAMYLMSGFPFRRVGGELSRMLCLAAEENLKKVMPSSLDYQIDCCDAGSWNGYDAYNIFYIYNSFPKTVIHEVNEKLCESVKKRHRKVIVLYLFPEFPEEFAKDSRWRLLKKGFWFELRHGMHIYEGI